MSDPLFLLSLLEAAVTFILIGCLSWVGHSIEDRPLSIGDSAYVVGMAMGAGVVGFVYVLFMPWILWVAMAVVLGMFTVLAWLLLRQFNYQHVLKLNKMVLVAIGCGIPLGIGVVLFGAYNVLVALYGAI